MCKCASRRTQGGVSPFKHPPQKSNKFAKTHLICYNFPIFFTKNFQNFKFLNEAKMIEISEEEYARLKAAEQALIAMRSKENEKAKMRLRQMKNISIRVEPDFYDVLKTYCSGTKVSIRQTILKAIEEFTNNEVSARKS